MTDRTWLLEADGKAAVMLAVLPPGADWQGDPLTTPEQPRVRALMQTLDRINAKMGRDSIRLAVEGLDQRWKMRQACRNPGYTTCWDELPRVS